MVTAMAYPWCARQRYVLDENYLNLIALLLLYLYPCVTVQEEVAKARVPLANRDCCVDVLIPLNECRRKNYYLPWKCEHERHAYELCQYKAYKSRTG